MSGSKAAFAQMLVCVLCLVASAYPQGSPESQESAVQPSLWGLRVESISIQGIDKPETLRELLVQKEGEPLDKRQIQQTIKKLFATGRFADVRVEADRVGTGAVALTIHAVRNWFIGAMTIEGAVPPPSENQLLNAAKLQLGEQWEAEKGEQAISRMKRTLLDNGFYDPKITIELEQQEAAQLVHLHFFIVPGERARVGEIDVRGQTGYSAEEVRGITKLKRGKKVTAEALSEALRRLRNRYQKKDRLAAEVSIIERNYRPETNTVDYVFQIDRGPTIDVHLEGAKLRKGQIKRYVPIYEEGAVDEDLLNEGRRNLRDYFQTLGYFDVDVEVSERYVPEENHRHIVYDIDRGARHKLETITIEGNNLFDDETIRERMFLEEAGLILSHGRYSEALLERDVEAIENLYRENGHQQVQVLAQVDHDTAEEDGRIDVKLMIEEGPRTLVRSLRWEGISEERIAQLEQYITTSEGQPYSDSNIATDRESILNYYYDNGFAAATFDASVAPDPEDSTRVNVIFRITEGPQNFVNKIYIAGLNHTRGYVARREYEIAPGEPLSQTALLNTQRKLYDLGIFNQVNIAIENPEGEEADRNVLIQVEEAKRYTFNYGFGFEVATGSDPGSDQPEGRTGFSPRVSFDVTRINFRGRGHTVVFKSRLGRLQQRALVSYIAPKWFGNEDLEMTFTSFYDDTRDVRTFTAARVEGSVQAKHVLRKREDPEQELDTMLYRFTYRRVRVDPDTLVIDPNLIPQLSQPVRIGMPSLTYIRERRRDVLDPRSGSHSTADFGISSAYFGSEASFTRLLLQNSTYHPFGKGQKYVLARSTRIGVEAPFSSGEIIPLPERLFGGGSNSHRGFAINQAGPRDLETGFPIGGEAMFFNLLELRMPPVELPFLGDSVSTVLFHDAGNVFESSKQMFSNLLQFKQQDVEKCRSLTPTDVCDFSYISHALGAGIRYKTPIGPVRVDFAYNLNPPVFPIREDARTDRLSKFNFFFSIGQTF